MNKKKLLVVLTVVAIVLWLVTGFILLNTFCLQTYPSHCFLTSTTESLILLVTYITLLVISTYVGVKIYKSSRITVLVALSLMLILLLTLLFFGGLRVIFGQTDWWEPSFDELETNNVLCSLTPCSVNADCDGVYHCPSGANCSYTGTCQI